MKSRFSKVFCGSFSSYGFMRRHLQCSQYDVNDNFFVLLGKIYKVHSAEVWIEDPRQRKLF
jgi:hypothetical protein